MVLFKGRILLLFLLVLPVYHIQAQNTDPVNLIGLTLSELINRFGIPNNVYAVRGLEEWQDDVVFVYNEGDFYIHRNRVWQMGVRAVRGINIGDPRGIVSLILGERVESRGNSKFYSLVNWPWPMIIRFDFDGADRVRAIFIYRSDL